MIHSKNIYFTSLLVGVLLGIGVQNVLSDIWISLAFLCAFFCAFFSGLLRFGRVIYIAYVILLGSIFGVSYTSNAQQKIEERLNILAPYDSQYLQYEGVVEGVQARDDFSDTYVMRLSQIGDRDISQSLEHLLRVPKNFRLEVGETVGYAGKLYQIEDFNGFAYKKYMLSQGIYFSTSTNSIQKILPAPKNITTAMYRFREGLLERIATLYPEQEAIFLGGILFGARENISDDLKTHFNNSGLTHFIAVSGFNITLCILFITAIFGFLPVWGRIIAVSFSVSLFSLFVGLGAPVVRAALMGILGYVFLQTGNSIRNITLLAFVAVCMCLYSPLALIYDVSFQLSFLAVIGIMYTQELFGNIFRFVPSFLAIREAFVLTLSALSFTLPLMIFQFGQISLLAPLANIAVTWTIPLAMLGGALSVIVDIFSHKIAVFVSFFEWLLLRYDIAMVYLFGGQNWSVWKVDFGVYQYYFEVLYFLLLTYLITLYHLKKTKKQPI